VSDHRYIRFQIDNVKITNVTFCYPKRTGWKFYVEDLTISLEAAAHCIFSVQDKELAVDWLQSSSLTSYYHNCVVRFFTHQGRFIGGIKS
jgi:hypothetical protein